MQAATAPVATNRRQRLLASLLEKAGLKNAASRIPQRTAASGPVQLSSGQRRLWFLDRVAPQNPVYNVPTAFRIRGQLNVPAFHRALTEIVRRHEILRTTFTQRNGDPFQVVAEHADVALSVIDHENRCDASLKARAIEEARRPFDLERGPLMRVVLFRVGAEDHLVLITMHHIICDGWSMGILFRELSSLYAAAIRNTPAFLPDLPVQYADYSAWQRERLDGGALQPQMDFWWQHLQGAPTVFELPSDRPRPPAPAYGGGILNIAIGPPVSDALDEIAQSESTTPFVLMLAAYATLLHRYSGQLDFIVGCPVSNRNRSELEPLIGFFPNTLPLRIRISGEMSFLTLLRNVRQLAADAFANAEAPFETIAGALGSSRSPHNPLFQVAFMMQDQAPSRITFGDIEITPIELDLGTSKCDLTLVGAKAPDGFNVTFEYAADLFDSGTIRRMMTHFETLLDAISSNPEASLSDLPLMKPAEEQRVLNEWSATSTAPKIDTRTLQELFEEHAKHQPEAPALVFGSTTTMYGELNRQANRIAHALRQSGAGPGALIAIALQRSPALIAAILGVLKSGAAYLPLALDHPADRITFQIEDANPMMLITAPENRSALPRAAQQLEWLDISNLPRQDADPVPVAQPSDVAYVIYTSGSTGKPKGAMLEHRGLTNLAMAQQSMFELGPGCRVLQFAPPTFDASVWELAMALGSGGCLCLGSGAAFLPEELSRTLQQQRVTTVTLPPSILRTLSPADLPELRTIISAGEDCPDALARLWSHGRSFFNAYGPTETTVCATVLRYSGSSQRMSIGRPLPNVRTYILDPQMRPMPPGVPGELHIGGAGVARGYLKRAELTRTRFVANPFEPHGGRLYKSGDAARYLPDGEIEFLGRIDGQVKIRGHRIEPGEIEARLESHPEVRQSAVVVREEQGRDPRLVAYFVPFAAAPGSEELRTFAAQTLPAYMVPSAFVPLPDLPVNSSGKIDRRLLAQKEITAHHTGSTAPRDDLERSIAEIWSEVLCLPSVGVSDNFFELGGNSLMAVNLMARIAARTGCDLPVTALFQAGTVEQIARCIRERADTENASGGVIRLQPRGSKPPLILVPPAGGSVICYSDMARLFSPDQPVLGVEPVRGLAPAESVELLAARYIEELDSAVLNGPLQLAGWSFGGNVAFEMARQLAQLGRRPDLVILLDSYAAHKSKEPDDEDILLEIARVQALARGLELQMDRRRLRRLKGPDRALLIAEHMNQHSGLSPETIAGELRTIHQRFRTDMRAARRYVPGYYGGRVALLRASARRWSGDHGWSAICPNLELHDIPGGHRTLLTQPHVAAVVGMMREVTARFFASA